jgi:hypothetical protein
MAGLAISSTIASINDAFKATLIILISAPLSLICKEMAGDKKNESLNEQHIPIFAFLTLLRARNMCHRYPYDINYIMCKLYNMDGQDG